MLKMAGMHLQLVWHMDLSSATTSLGCGLHEVMTAGEQALARHTERQNLVVPAICSDIITAHCQLSYLHRDPIQQQAAPLSVCHTLHQTATVAPGC